MPQPLVTRKPPWQWQGVTQCPLLISFVWISAGKFNEGRSVRLLSLSPHTQCRNLPHCDPNHFYFAILFIFFNCAKIILRPAPHCQRQPPFSATEDDLKCPAFSTLSTRGLTCSTYTARQALGFQQIVIHPIKPHSKMHPHWIVLFLPVWGNCNKRGPA